MSVHELDLLDNALDSLAEALVKYKEGREDQNPKAYKFAVLHMSHFVELIFKYHLAEKHPLLIYTNPFAPKVDKNKTIGLWEAVNFINNEKSDALSKDFKTDLEWLKKLRNEIEHHKFVMDVDEVKTTIGRLFRSLMEFLEEYSDIDIASSIPKESYETFKVLSDEYEFKLQHALDQAEEIEVKNTDWSHSGDEREVRFNCDACGNYTLAISQESITGFKCTFCGEVESDELPCNCSSCGAEAPIGEMTHSKTEDGDSEYRCYYCSGRYQMDKDD